MPDEVRSVAVAQYATRGTVKYTDGDPTLPQAAALFAALPLATEAITLLLFYETRWEFFAVGMVIAVSFGVVFVAMSLMFLLAQLTFSSGPQKLHRFFRNSRLAIVLLVLNVLATPGLVWLFIKYK